jgi:hypothetical protein
LIDLSGNDLSDIGCIACICFGEYTSIKPVSPGSAEMAKLVLSSAPD